MRSASVQIIVSGLKLSQVYIQVLQQLGLPHSLRTFCRLNQLRFVIADKLSANVAIARTCGVSKKVAPLTLLRIFSFRLSIFA